MQEYNSALAAAILKSRAALGITQDALSEATGITSRTILKCENGRGNPQLKTLYILIRELKIDANSIFYPEIESNTSFQVQLQQVIADCSEAEVKMLLDICKDTLSATRSKKYATID